MSMDIETVAAIWVWGCVMLGVVAFAAACREIWGRD
jgi:hypothetical protein